MRSLTPFLHKTNLRENRFFAARWRLVDGKGTQNVKFIAENYTKWRLYRVHAHRQRNGKHVHF